MIIGITGTMGAGKDEAAKYFMKLGFAYHQCSDIIRKQCMKKGIPLTLENLTDQSNELRKQHGPGIFARIILERIKALDEQNSLVIGIRNPAEIEELKKQGNFVLIAVDAPVETRYERTQHRAREDDKLGFDEFRDIEQRQRSGTDSNAQQLDKTISMADFKIINDGSIKDLHEKLDDLMDYLRRGKK